VPVLEVDRLVKRYRGGTLANDGITLAVEPGEVYGLLGPNGAGKTTLVRQVLGLLRPTSGSIRLNGRDIVANPGYARQAIGFLPQGQFLMDQVHVDELILGIAKLRGLPGAEARRATEHWIERLDLGAFRTTPLAAASGGVRRLAGFACTVAGGSRMLVLDEPTNDVDPVRRALLWGSIAELARDGASVLLVTHNLAEAERVIGRFAIIDHGRIVREGTPAALRTLVSDHLRVEITAAGAITPHPALHADAANPGSYLLDHRDLAAASAWIQGLREAGTILDFRIGPPTLDDIYAASVRGEAAGSAA